MRLLVSMLLILGLNSAATAATKVYTSSNTAGSEGESFTTIPANCPAVESQGGLGGSATITDTGSGTVTLDVLNVTPGFNPFPDGLDLTFVLGPGAFFFSTANDTQFPAPGQTGAGSTAKGTGAITWGILGGWKATGGVFCLSSPLTNCSGAGFIHGSTVPNSVSSPTYDLGTWSFDAAGDYSGTPYIENTFDGGSGNSQNLLRGAFVGAGLPALPVVGFAALALALAGVGARSLIHRR